jgi:hypothetical protein
MPASPGEALAMLESAMSYLAAADPTAMAAESQAQALCGLERLDAIEAAARTAILGAFTAAKGYTADGDYSPRSWLIHRTRITRAVANAHVAWIRRAAAHPLVVADLTVGQISESFARTICAWTAKFPAGSRQDADEALLGAVATGATLPQLAEFAATLYARSLPGTPGPDSDEDFDDRSVRVATTFEGAGVISGNLTPECAALVTTVLDSLSAPSGPEDARTHGQRFHDALQEALNRLVTAGLLPERAGQPTKAIVHVSLADLCALDADSALQQEWIARVRGQWSAARAAASQSGGDGSAWLDGPAAQAITCDATMTPVVTGDVDPAALDDLVRLCVQLAGHGTCGHQPDARHQPDAQPDAQPGPQHQPGAGTPAAAHSGTTAAPGLQSPLSPRARAALEQAIIGKAVDLLSGPGGLASFLRTRLLDARLAGPSLPLDIGVSTDIPAAIRRAVTVRAKGHCEWPGGCTQPASACQVHHVRHQANGGDTSLRNCVLICHYHHQVCVHRWGWTLVLNPDGTTTARSPDGLRVFRSHGPPTARAG